MPPEGFDRFARKNGEQEHDGKKIDVIYGIKAGKSSIQALRYNKETWTAQSARAHCGSRDGTFEAAAEAKEVSMTTKEAMSDNDKRELLQTAVIDSLAIGNRDHGPWIRDVYDTELVYEIGGKSYRMSYVIDRKGKVVFGQAELVTPTTVYTPVKESVEAKIDELAEAASGREEKYNSSVITDRLLELLEIDELTEAVVIPIIAEADVLIAKLSEAAPAKTEDGIAFPAAAYAYVPDKEKSSTWKLRLWEDLEKRVTRKQLGAAAAAFSPGGFRGQKVAIPSADVPAVKRKIRAEYRKLDVKDEEIPRWIKEIETRELVLEFTTLSEANIDGKGIAEVDIIKPGFNSDDSRYYPIDMLARDFSVFEGVKMYSDHPSKEDERNRPERSIRDWVATLSEVCVDEATGKLKGKATIIESWFKEKLSNLKDQGLLSNLGVSINAIGKGVKSKIEGKSTTVIEKLLTIRSVDFVTEPGAGGIVVAYESADTDVDLIDVEALRERRPDLIMEIESVIKEKIQAEVRGKMEAEERITQLEGQVETLTTENTSLKEEKAQAEKEKTKAEAQVTIKEAVDKAELPDAAKTRLIEAHKERMAEMLLRDQAILRQQTHFIADQVRRSADNRPSPRQKRDLKKISFRQVKLIRHPECEKAPG